MVTATTAASMHLNPAALASVGRTTLQVDAAAISASIGYTRERRASYQYADSFKFKLPLDAADIDASRSGTLPRMSGSTLAPTAALAFAMPLGDRWAVGLSAVPEYAAVLKLPDDGPHRWQLQETFVLVEMVSLGVAFAVTDKLHIGASADLAIGMMSLRQVTDLAATDMLGGAFANPPINQANDFGTDAPPGVRELDVLSRAATVHEATAIAGSFKAGLVFLPSPSWRLAAAWQQGIDMVYEGDFYLDMDHPFFTTDLAGQGLKYPRQVRGDAFVELPAPSVLRLGVGWRGASVGVQVQASWLRYSAVKSLDVTIRSPDLAQPELGLGDVVTLGLDRSWMDTFEVESLVDVALGEAWKLGVRAGYHSPVSPDATMDLLSLDGQRLIGGLAARWQATDALALTAHVSGHHVLSRTVQASNFDRGNGVYDLSILIAGAGVQWQL